jgi:hypothetical protein
MKNFFLSLFLIFFVNFTNAQVFSEINKVVASDREELGRFGQSVDISGNYAVVGAYGMGAFNNGQAYIFEKQGTNWIQTQILQNSDNENYDRFGYSVAIDGDYIVIGAYGEDDDVNGNNNLSKAGSAYIFKNNTGTWTQVQKIIANDRSAGDEFGWSVAIDGNTIIIGAHLEEEDENGFNTIYHAGSAYIFELNGGTGIWSQTQKIVAGSRAADLTYPNGGNAGEDVSDLFGHSVAISGNYIVVGSLNHDWDETNTNSTLNGGAVYIFEKNLGTWTEVQKIVNSDVQVSDRFGAAVAIDSNFIAVGSYSQDYSLTGTNYMPNSGAVYICKKDVSGNWAEQQKIVAPVRNTGDRFGWSVALDSVFLVVGAKEDNDNKNETNPLVDAGAAHIFKRDNINGIYSHIQKIDASDRDSLDLFGNAVGMDGTTIIIGALEQDFNSQQIDSINNAGAAYFFNEISCPSVLVNQNLTICNGQTITVGTNTYNTDGTYQDTLTSVNGCDSIVITNLSVTNGFEITQNINICYGESYSIGNSTYSIPGNYSDTLQMVSGTCDSIVYTNLNVIPPIDISVNVNDNNIESNQSNAFYQWIDCDNNYQFVTNTVSNQKDIDIVETGNYAVIINVNGCIDTSACVLVEYLGLNKNNLNGEFINIYPNPANETVTISNPNLAIVKLEIIDFTGKIVYQTTSNVNKKSINISAFNSGFYVIKIITNNQTVTKQFIKE